MKKIGGLSPWRGGVLTGVEHVLQLGKEIKSSTWPVETLKLPGELDPQGVPNI